MKVCNTIELNTPSDIQMLSIINNVLPNINDFIKKKIINYVQSDIRKLTTIFNIYNNKPEIFDSNIIENFFQLKSYNDDTKKITYKLLNNLYSIDNHNNIMNETDRTSVGLLWHENIIDCYEKINKTITIPLYVEQLENICFSDYIDRITFQKQIWQFNEMSSLIKTFKNNKLYHDSLNNEIFKPLNKKKTTSNDIRFTKVLTKYSTEYNNYIFIQELCQKISMDKKDLFGYLIYIKSIYDDNQIYNFFENYEISKLDINRIYRYLDKYMKEDALDITYKETDIDFENNYGCEEEIDSDI